MTSKTRRLTTCHRHPSQPITGFCASCLTERLSGIESADAEPELRRSKSCSGSRAGDQASSSAVEPRRRSCEILAPPEQNRGTLSDLFNIDDEKKKQKPGFNRCLENESRKSRFEIIDFDGGCDIGRVLVEDENDEEETKTMKEFIDLEIRSGKNAGRDSSRTSFWDAASVFSKRLRKWKRKQKLKRNNADCEGGVVTGNGGGLRSMEVEKQRRRNLRETQSEVGEYGLSLCRRSCDTDPRLSVDDSRFSFDAPRASWDGYLIGKTCSRFSPMVAINDDRVLVEEEEDEEGEEEVVENLESCGGGLHPGGSAETKHYYSDRRRRSFDRSNPRRKSAVIGDVDELRVISNAKVSPATTELFYGAKVLITEEDLRDANLKPKNSVNVQSDCRTGSASKEACDVEIGNDQKGTNKFHKWGKLWNKLGLVQKRKEDKLGEEESVAGDVVNKPIAESWQKLRRVVNGQGSESVSQKLIRSYSVSCKNHSRTAGLVNGLGGGTETKCNVLNGRQELTLQRNRSVRYSTSNVDTGLLRFYLTPLKSYRRSRSGKSNSKDFNPSARSFS